MEIKDLAGLSKPLTRLIEVISTGVGNVSASYFIRKNAEAHAYEIKIIAKALNSVSNDFKLPVVYKDGQIGLWQKTEDSTLVIQSPEFEKRLELRNNYQERKRQNNIETITSNAASNLLNIGTVPDNKPDEDWIARFFNYAQDINSSEMQDLWGRILSGEIKNPGSYSLRTLDAIRNITKEDAQLFELLSKVALKSSNGIWLIPIFPGNLLQSKFKIYPTHHFHLSELNLIYPTDLSLTIFSNDESEVLFLTENTLLLVAKGKIQNPIKIPIWKFTQVGGQIISLIEKPYDDEYYTNIANYFKTLLGEVTIGKIKSIIPDGRIEYDTIKIIKNE